MSKVFLDTAYAIALPALNDQYHERAVVVATQLEKDRTILVTTRAVVLEIGNVLAKLRYRQGAVQLLQALEVDPQVEIIANYTNVAFDTARADKEWGITDCISLVAMQEQGLTRCSRQISTFSKQVFGHYYGKANQTILALT